MSLVNGAKFSMNFYYPTYFSNATPQKPAVWVQFLLLIPAVVEILRSFFPEFGTDPLRHKWQVPEVICLWHAAGAPWRSKSKGNIHEKRKSS
jgi:hypothetical protein